MFVAEFKGSTDEHGVTSILSMSMLRFISEVSSILAFMSRITPSIVVFHWDTSPMKLTIEFCSAIN